MTSMDRSQDRNVQVGMPVQVGRKLCGCCGERLDLLFSNDDDDCKVVKFKDGTKRPVCSECDWCAGCRSGNCQARYDDCKENDHKTDQSDEPFYTVISRLNQQTLLFV